MKGLHEIEPTIPEEYIYAAMGLYQYGCDFQYRITYDGKRLEYRRPAQNESWARLNGLETWAKRGRAMLDPKGDRFKRAAVRFIRE